jgi:hypothetical protein
MKHGQTTKKPKAKAARKKRAKPKGRTPRPPAQLPAAWER